MADVKWVGIRHGFHQVTSHAVRLSSTVCGITRFNVSDRFTDDTCESCLRRVSEGFEEPVELFPPEKDDSEQVLPQL